MANKAIYQKRWFDQEDFIPEHDEMMIWMIENIEDFIKSTNFYTNTDSIKMNLLQEPVLDGYPPVYPDAILEVFYGRLDQEKKRLIFIIEIKPKIDSYGSVTRQFSLYKKRAIETYGKHGIICLLISKDTRFNEYFMKNNICPLIPY